MKQKQNQKVADIIDKRMVRKAECKKELIASIKKDLKRRK